LSTIRHQAAIPPHRSHSRCGGACVPFIRLIDGTLCTRAERSAGVVCLRPARIAGRVLAPPRGRLRSSTAAQRGQSCRRAPSRVDGLRQCWRRAVPGGFRSGVMLMWIMS
jgi:hypothetical protein